MESGCKYSVADPFQRDSQTPDILLPRLLSDGDFGRYTPNVVGSVLGECTVGPKWGN